jgi:hypothetical protein
LTRTGRSRAIITSPVGSESAPLTGWARRVAHPVRAGPLSHLIDEWIKSLAKRLPYMLPVQPRYRPTVGQLARAHTFRFLTMIAAWALIFAAFIYHPEWIRESLRFMTHSRPSPIRCQNLGVRGSRLCSASWAELSGFK